MRLQRGDKSIAERLRLLLNDRILIMDGAMGTMLQSLQFTEYDFRGERFKWHPTSVKGNYDMLSLTKPDAVTKIHNDFLAAGADIIATNTFTSNSISQRYFASHDFVYELNLTSARIARACADHFTLKNAFKPRFVAGVIGPTNHSATMRNGCTTSKIESISFDELVETYAQAIPGLVDGGVDIFLIETIFDTLNAKAALSAIDQCYKGDDNSKLPIMLSMTFADQSGRTLSGHTIEAFFISVQHSNPLAVGLNCALGAEQMRPFLQRLSNYADTFVFCYPNAGLPNAMGGYDDKPEQMGKAMRAFGDAGLLNLGGGCCGSTPAHIRAIADALKDVPPRVWTPKT